MSQYLKEGNPYNPGYALPKNVQAEGLRRGTEVTKWLPEGTIAPTPETVPPWKTGYALPPNVLREPLGRGTLVTAWSPSGTVHTLAPDTFAKTTLTSPPGSLGSLGDAVAAPRGNPLQQYGHEAAAVIAKTAAQFPPDQQREVIKSILDQVDPKIWRQVKEDPSRKNLAAALSSGLTQEIINLGEGKRKGAQKQLALAGLWSGLKSVGSGIGGALKKIGSLGCKAANNPLTPAVAAAAGAAAGGSPQTGLAGAVVARTLCASSSAPPQQFYQAGFTGVGSPPWMTPIIIGGGVLLLVLALRK